MANAPSLEHAESITVLYIDGSIGFGGSSRSLSLAMRGLTGVRKLMVTAQEPDIVRELFGSVPSWRFRRWINYRTRARLVELLEHRPRWARVLVLKLYALLDTVVIWVNAARIARIARSQNAGLIHMNNGYHPPEGILAARLTGLPIIGHLRAILSPPTADWLSAVSHADCTIVVSDAAGAALRAALPDANIRTIYNPVSVDDVEGARAQRGRVRRELGAAKTDILIGIFGRVVRWKGQLEFVRACIKAMPQDPRIKAVIVGSTSDGAADYMVEVKEAIHASGLGEHFILTGYRSDVEAVYAAMDIVVHASISAEPFGRVIVEAMAAGIPVIAADEGGPREIITPEVDGLLTPTGDVETLAQAMLRLSANEDLRNTIGQRAAEAVHRRFTVERHAQEVKRVYDDVLSARLRATGEATPRRS